MFDCFIVFESSLSDFFHLSRVQISCSRGSRKYVSYMPHIISEAYENIDVNQKS